MTSYAFKDLTGQTFSRWFVLSRGSTDKHRRIHWKCRCMCGAEKEVNGADLRNGRSKSCGCWYLGDGHHKWNGGKGVNQKGYVEVYVTDYPGARGPIRTYEHIYVMAKHLGRPLASKETVHHKNGIKSDNKIRNLELWASKHPPGQRVTDLLEWARELIKQYETEECLLKSDL